MLGHSHCRAGRSGRPPVPGRALTAPSSSQTSTTVTRKRFKCCVPPPHPQHHGQPTHGRLLAARCSGGEGRGLRISMLSSCCRRPPAILMLPPCCRRPPPPKVTIAAGGTMLTIEPFNNDQKWVVAAELGPVQCSVRSMPLTWPLTACVAFHQNATKMAGFTMRDARSMDCRDREQLAVRRAPAVRAQLIRSSGPAKVRSKFKSAD